MDDGARLLVCIRVRHARREDHKGVGGTGSRNGQSAVVRRGGWRGRPLLVNGAYSGDLSQRVMASSLELAVEKNHNGES